MDSDKLKHPNPYLHWSITPDDKVIREFSYNLKYEEHETDVEINLEIDGVDASQPIHIYDKTWLKYRVTTNDGKVGYAEWTLSKENGSEEISLNGLRIDPENLIDGEQYTLTAHAYVYIDTPAPSGGWAEPQRIGKTFTFTIEMHKAEKKLNLRQGITSDGHLIIEWDNPDLSQVPVERYELRYFDMSTRRMIDITITDPNETFFIDRHYVYGHQQVTLWAFFANGAIETWSDTLNVAFDEITSDNLIIEETGIDKVKLGFNFPRYTSQCYLFVGEGTAYSSRRIRITPENLPIELDRPCFPDEMNIRVCIYPEGTNEGDTFYWYDQHSVEKTLRYNNIQIDNSIYEYIPSPYDKRLYIRGDRWLATYDAKTLDKIGKTPFSGELYVESKSTRKVVQNDNDVRIYKDGSFSNPIYFQINTGNQSRGALRFTQDGMLLASVKAGTTRVVNVYDPNNGNFVGAVSLPTTYPAGAMMKSFGKYISVFHDDKLDIYELNGFSATLLKTYTGDETITVSPYFRYYSYNGQDYITAHVQSGNKEALVKLPSMQGEVVDCAFGNVDPVTGNLLIFTVQGDSHYAQIWKRDGSTKLLQFKVHSEPGNSLLFNNIYYGTLGRNNCTVITYIDLSNHITP